MPLGNSFNVSVTGNTREIQRHLSFAERKALPKAKIMALNKTGKKAHTQMVRKVAKDHGVKNKAVRQRLFFKGKLRARRGSFEAVILFRGREFSAVSAKRVYQTKKGVVVNGELVPGAFIVRTQNGNKQVFKRTSSSRYPIEVVNIHGEVTQGGRGGSVVAKDLDRLATQVFQPVVRKNFPRELDRAMRLQLDKYTKGKGR